MVCLKCGSEMEYFKENDAFGYYIDRYRCKKCKIEYRETYKSSGWFDKNGNEMQNIIGDLIIYTDGACSGNPGPGGWATIILDSDNIITKLSGSDKSTTNNRMEIMAVIEGLKSIDGRARVEIITDSSYVVNTMTKGWKRNKNQDLWDELDSLVAKHEVVFTWVKGHASNIYNNECDKMAVAEYQKYKL